MNIINQLKRQQWECKKKENVGGKLKDKNFKVKTKLGFQFKWAIERK